MSLAEVRHALRSEARNVLVEAPAGCGKTFEAASLAGDLGTSLPDGGEILLLAHTNAAVQEFTRRCRERGARAHATTIDAFCLELLEPYAARLGLPTPLRRYVGLGAGRLPFTALAPHAALLLERCPSVAHLVARRYPFVILDEHQDAHASQHKVVALFRNLRRCRVRVFGDPMQAIYEADAVDGVPWSQLEEEADQAVGLDTPQRWPDAPRLGEWILRAREALRTGGCLPAHHRQDGVTISHLPTLSCVGYGYGNYGALARPVREFVREAEGTVAVLSRHNNHVWGLHVAAGGLVLLNEGSQYDDAYALLEQAIAADGAAAMGHCLLGHLAAVSTGLTQPRERAIRRALQPDRLDLPRQEAARFLLAKFEPLYRTPDLATFCGVAGSIVRDPPSWLTIRKPMSLRLLSHSRPVPGSHPADSLDQIIMRIKSGARRLRRVASTIHKAKGLEFDHVMVANFSAAHFPDNEAGRRLAYVALSRARKSVTFLVPGDAPSPLLG